MPHSVDHQEALERAELFGDLIHSLLAAIHSPDAVTRNFLVPRSSSGESTTIDDLVRIGDGRLLLVETRAPYTEEQTVTIGRGLQHLREAFDGLEGRDAVTELILAVACEPAHPVLERVNEARAHFSHAGVTLTLWTEKTILTLTAKHLGVVLTALFAPDLTRALEHVRKTAGEVPPAEPQHAASKLPVGQQHDVVVLAADFCSYSKFVHASLNNHDLISSIMSRFYRQTRGIILDHGGVVDKYMGDGVLCYWLNANGETKAQLDGCVRALIGASVSLAREWEEWINDSITHKGMRAGAAIGEVLFISEGGPSGDVHALSDSINLAVRLQSAAKPNTLVIANVLNSKLFRDDNFEKLPPLKLKNIGTVTAWRKPYLDGPATSRGRRASARRRP
jgi:class 3 adenylate cyclase